MNVPAIVYFVLATMLVLVLGLTNGDAILVGTLALTAVAMVSLTLLVRIDHKVGVGLVALFLVALATRWLVASMVQYFVYAKQPALFAPDEYAYEFNTHFLALYFEGKAPDPYPDGGSVAIVWIGAPIYYLFGRQPLLLKLAMGIIGAWTAVLSALFAHRVVPEAARRAGYLCALFPSLVLWSSLYIKDGFTLFGVLLCLVSFSYFRERFSVLPIMVFMGGAAALGFSRPYELAFVVAGVLSTFLLLGRRNFFRNATLLVLFSTVALLAASRLFQSPVDIDQSTSLLSTLATVREGYASGAGSAINYQVVDVRSPAGALAWLPIGLVYFFFAPFPFTGGSTISLATTPEMIAWYLMAPWVWRGMRLTLRLRRTEIMPFFFYAVTSAAGWAMLITNVGTIYRYRSQVLFVALLFFAAEWERRRQMRAQREAPVAPLRSAAA